MLLGHEEYLKIKEMVNEKIKNKYNDIWIKHYIEKYLYDNNLKLEDLTFMNMKLKVNPYLIELYRKNLLAEIETVIEAYKYRGNHFQDASTLESLANEIKYL